MAAAEYFSSAPMRTSGHGIYQIPTIQSQTPTPSPYQQQSQQIQQRPPPMSSPSQQYSQHTHQGPPPYQEHNVHFAQNDVDIPQRHSFSHQQRPNQSSWNRPAQQHNYSHHGNSPQHIVNSNGSTPNGHGTPPQSSHYLSPHMRPHANPNSSQYSLSNGGYASDPEHSRRHKHRSGRDSGSTRDGGTRSVRSNSRSTNKDAFLGAAGGGLIGDLIFPGLGTVGGAAIGWLGGKDYGRHRKDREDKRDKEQEKWEKKYRPDQYRARRHGSSEY